MRRLSDLGVTMLRCRQSPMQKLAGFRFLLVGWLVFLSPMPSWATPGPTEVVRQFYGQLLDTMQHASTLGAKGRYQKLEPVVLSTFDVPFMARLSIGPLWAKLTAEQKRRAAAAYGRYIGAVYATRFDGYSGERLEVLGEQQIKHGTLVKTQIVKSNGEPVSINYVLHDNDTGWQIRDAYLSGAISELATRRSEFSTILRTNGIDALIASLNKKADDLQS
jgi:phospholipid transport system substrate-binding protein